MSGHSHFSTIKRKKEVSDKKRGQIFSKLSRIISLAAKEKGSDPGSNSKLRLAIEKAKEFNMPSQTIEKAIKRGTGELEGIKLEEIIFEAYGPANIAIIIEGITDNKNRTLGEVKQILTKNGGKLVQEGSVKWLFERKGVITVNTENQKFKEDEIILKTIEAGAEDVYHYNNNLDNYTKIEDLEKTKKNLEDLGIKIERASLDWVPKNMIQLDEKTKNASQKLFEDLDENDAVQEIYSNLKI